MFSLSSFYATTAIVTTNYNMFNLQVNYSVFKDGKKVTVCMHDHIGYIPVYKDLSWLGARNFIGRNPTVAATNP